MVPVRLDVTDRAQIAAAATAHGDLDLLVCNAGVTCQRPLLSDVTDAALREVMEVNFFGPLSLARAFAAGLRRPGSGVIFVLSVSAVALSRSAPVYSASKAACLMLASQADINVGCDSLLVETTEARIQVFTYKSPHFERGPLIVVCHGMLRNADRLEELPFMIQLAGQCRGPCRFLWQCLS